MILTAEGLDALATPLWATYGLFSEWGVVDVPMPRDARAPMLMRVAMDLQRINKIVASRSKSMSTPPHEIATDGTVGLQAGYHSSIRANIRGSETGIVLNGEDAEIISHGITHFLSVIGAYLRYEEPPVWQAKENLQLSFLKAELHLADTPQKREALERSKIVRR